MGVQYIAHPNIIMEWLIVMAVVGLVFSFAKSDMDRQSQIESTFDLQHDAQAFESDQAELGRDWQEQFWKENQSPAALVSQFKNLGASDSAALMSALGVNSSVPSPSVGSSSQSSLPFMGNSFADLLNSFQGKMNDFYQNQKTKAEAEKISTETQWMPIVNKFTIDKGIAELDNMKKRLDLDSAVFENVTKPIAQSTIDLNSVEIDKKISETENLKQEWFNLVEQFYNIRSQTTKNYAEANLSNEKAATEPYIRQNLSANTNKTYHEGLGVELENSFKRLSLQTSETLGFDVRLPATTNLFTMAASDVKNIVEVLDRNGNWIDMKINDFFDGVESGFKGVRSALKFQETSKKIRDGAVDFFDKSLPKWSPAYQDWLKNRGQRMSEIEDYINRNTRYGYNKDWKPLWNNKNERRSFHDRRHGFEYRGL